MNIKILDSWLKDYVKTNASAEQIAEKLSLSSVSVERLEKHGSDYLYDIEVTTNRPDLMSLVGLARETTAALSQNNIAATFSPPKLPLPKGNNEFAITIKNDPTLVNRVCAVIMEVVAKPSPKEIRDQLEATDMRSLNNLIDITNYVMRVIGHPTHVFDFDRLATNALTIRESKVGEMIETLDKKKYKLLGGDIVAQNDEGEIVDLLGVMGLENSVVTDQTKRILFFIDNVNPHHVRKTSMSLGIRTEAAVLNEKELDPELAMDALLYGIQLFEKFADGKVVSSIIDVYPNKTKTQTIRVPEEKIQKVIGISIPLKTSAEILQRLGFEVTIQNDMLIVIPPSFRSKDIEIAEDVIEEIARIYGYDNIPNTLPPDATGEFVDLEKNELHWEDVLKDAMKYWGFTEVYTYPMVSEKLYEGPLAEAVAIANPLSEDMLYMRRSLVPSLLKVVRENRNHEAIHLFELANVYEKGDGNLPEERLKCAFILKGSSVSFFQAKGIVEQLAQDFGVVDLVWKKSERGGDGASIFIANDLLGEIEILGDDTIDTELDFQVLLKHATRKKIYKPLSKYPPIVEDLAIIAPAEVSTGDLMETIKKQNPLIAQVSLLDKYQDTRTFHIIYQSFEKNLTDKEVGEIREKILDALNKKHHAKLKK